jgi:hypothetical protein
MTELEFEKQLRSAAQEMEYPITPDIAGLVITRLRPSNRPRFASRKLAWSLTVMLVLVSSLMLIPTARAAILEFIQIGIVRIFPQPTEPPMDVIRTATPGVSSPSTATPVTDFPSLIPMLDTIAGETKLANARETAPYTILQPTYPSDLGPPNHVYAQDVEGVMTVLVWTDPQQPEHVTMSLHFIPAGHWAINKMGPQILEDTIVNDERALWAEGPYPLFLRNGNVEFVRLIEGHVLIWAEDEITYRLETDLSLAEAIKVAESLEPIR